MIRLETSWKRAGNERAEEAIIASGDRHSSLLSSTATAAAEWCTLDRAHRQRCARRVRVGADVIADDDAKATLPLRGKAYQINVMIGARTPTRIEAQALAVGRSFDLARGRTHVSC